MRWDLRDKGALTKREGKAEITFQEEGAEFQRFWMRHETKKASDAGAGEAGAEQKREWNKMWLKNLAGTRPDRTLQALVKILISVIKTMESIEEDSRGKVWQSNLFRTAFSGFQGVLVGLRQMRIWGN